MKEAETTLVHLWWDGPYTWREAEELNNNDDRGIYQLYGTHPIYGTEVLLYIGKAEDRPFWQRLREHRDENEYCDGDRILIYVGRLKYEKDEKNSSSEMKRRISEAEKLLIFAHGPAWNSQHVNTLGNIANIHIMNWNYSRMLMTEVSTKRQVTLDCKFGDHKAWPFAKYDK